MIYFNKENEFNMSETFNNQLTNKDLIVLLKCRRRMRRNYYKLWKLNLNQKKIDEMAVQVKKNLDDIMDFLNNMINGIFLKYTFKSEDIKDDNKQDILLYLMNLIDSVKIKENPYSYFTTIIINRYRFNMKQLNKQNSRFETNNESIDF
jgi:hypothetical protein